MKAFCLLLALLVTSPLFAQSTNSGGVQTSLGSETVSSSATPTFSLAYGTSYMVLTASVTTFTLPSGIDGQTHIICWKQGAGPYTVTGPTNVHGLFTIGTTNTGYNCQTYAYNAANTIWLATTPGVINE